MQGGNAHQTKFGYAHICNNMFTECQFTIQKDFTDPRKPWISNLSQVEYLAPQENDCSWAQTSGDNLFQTRGLLSKIICADHTTV